jgi:hypothetical protein
VPDSCLNAAEGVQGRLERYDVTVMQTPLIVFDHVNKQLVSLPAGRGADKRLDALIAWQREQVATSGRPAK